jgi:lysophospholipase L1-like esterase
MALHIFSSVSNPFLAKNVLRIYNPIYSHTLKSKYDGFDIWGPHRFRFLTNSLGFRDASTRDVPLVADHKRIVFIGDSITEGVGVPYEKTFVGRFASAFPNLDVLNAAVVSYSPSVYYEKLKYFLGVGLSFDEAIVYIDISDIQDEAIKYSYDEHGVLQMRWKTPEEKDWWERAFYVADFLNQVRLSQQWARRIENASLQDLMHSGVYSRDFNGGRADWTFDAKAPGYGSMGVEGGIQKAKQQMNRLHQTLSRHGIALSVGVYPWPQQLLYDSENSRQAKIWREWCAGKCKRFFDHFPAFFRYKRKDPEFIRSLFIWGDVHYNARGNQILAEDLIKKYRLQ